MWNLAGLGAPLLVAVWAIPRLLGALGPDRFGVLTLIWMTVSYSSLFDVGVGRSLSRGIVERMAAGRQREIPSLVWTAFFVALGLSLLGTCLLALLTPWLVHSLFRIPAAIQRETAHAFYLLALSIPAVVLTGTLRSVLEAEQRFDLVNAVRIPLGVVTFIGPLWVLQFAEGLFAVTAILVAARFLATILHLWLCLWLMPHLAEPAALRRRPAAWPLLREGGWMTVSAVVGPLIGYLDRFWIGASVSAAALAYYVTPNEMVTKLWLIPGAVVVTVFPAFTASLVQDRRQALLLLGRSLKYIFAVLFPLVFVLGAYSWEILNLWLGPEFARESSQVLRWLVCGVLINSLAHVPFALLQSGGRADLTAKVHLLETPVYFVALWWVVSSHGIVGVAMIWALRMALDASIMFVLAHRLLPGSAPSRSALLAVGGGALAPLLVGGLPGPGQKAFAALLVLGAFALLGWRRLLDPDERRFACELLRSARQIR